MIETARVLGVIPARLASERLPRKPLQPLAGRPLIEWVWRRVRAFEVLDGVVVATESEEVADVCRSFGAQVALTRPDHRSGTERVAEVVAREERSGWDVVVNVQGDEPFVAQAAVERSARLVIEGWDVGTVAAPVGTEAAWRDPSVVKVVRAGDGGALYFSRAPIPFRRDGAPVAAELAGPGYLRHIGVYAYGPSALERWVALPETELERAERLEQLRPLAAGMRIGVGLVEPAEAGIDTPADARRAEGRLRAMMGEAEPSNHESER